MTKDEALKLALEALKMADELCRGHGIDFKEYGLEFDRDIQVKYKDAITAIKEALAQPEQEPVAIRYDFDGYGYQYIDSGTGSDWQTRTEGEFLYTHPVKDLEDIDINITWNENSMRDFGKDELNFARAILRKAQNK